MNSGSGALLFFTFVHELEIPYHFATLPRKCTNATRFRIRCMRKKITPQQKAPCNIEENPHLQKFVSQKQVEMEPNILSLVDSCANVAAPHGCMSGRFSSLSHSHHSYADFRLHYFRQAEDWERNGICQKITTWPGLEGEDKVQGLYIMYGRIPLYNLTIYVGRQKRHLTTRFVPENPS